MECETLLVFVLVLGLQPHVTLKLIQLAQIDLLVFVRRKVPLVLALLDRPQVQHSLAEVVQLDVLLSDAPLALVFERAELDRVLQQHLLDFVSVRLFEVLNRSIVTIFLPLLALLVAQIRLFPLAL